MEAVRAFYERYNRGDIDGAMELFAPDAQLNNCVLGQIFDGNAAIRGFLDEYADIVEDPKAEPGELTEDDDLIIVPVNLRGRLRHTGITEDILPTELVHGFRLRDGKLAWFAICASTHEVLSAAGRHE